MKILLSLFTVLIACRPRQAFVGKELSPRPSPSPVNWFVLTAGLRPIARPIAYGTAADIACARDCAEKGIPSAIAVKQGDDYRLYLIEQSQLKDQKRVARSNWRAGRDNRKALCKEGQAVRYGRDVQVSFRPAQRRPGNYDRFGS
jgi:hypothetical protein